MENVLLASTVVDLLAVIALAVVVMRAGRGGAKNAARQRETLERLHTNLGQLIADAERRARALEEALGEREDSLRALLSDLGRRPLSAHDLRPGGADPTPLTRIDEVLAGDGRRRGLDAAEARLLRDLDVSLGRGRTA